MLWAFGLVIPPNSVEFDKKLCFNLYRALQYQQSCADVFKEIEVGSPAAHCQLQFVGLGKLEKKALLFIYWFLYGGEKRFLMMEVGGYIQ